MTTVSAPDNSYWVVVSCEPNGEASKIGAQWMDGMSLDMALALLEDGAGVVRTAKAQQDAEKARAALKSPDAFPQAAPAVAPPAVPDAPSPSPEEQEQPDEAPAAQSAPALPPPVGVPDASIPQ
jgi:hypothetical protein